MAEIEQIRRMAREAQTKVDAYKRDSLRIFDNFKALGASFTAERAYARSYSQLDQAKRELERAMDKYKEALRTIERAV